MQASRAGSHTPERNFRHVGDSSFSFLFYPGEAGGQCPKFQGAIGRQARFMPVDEILLDVAELHSTLASSTGFGRIPDRVLPSAIGQIRANVRELSRCVRLSLLVEFECGIRKSALWPNASDSSISGSHFQPFLAVFIRSCHSRILGARRFDSGRTNPPAWYHPGQRHARFCVRCGSRRQVDLGGVALRPRARSRAPRSALSEPPVGTAWATTAFSCALACACMGSPSALWDTCAVA